MMDFTYFITLLAGGLAITGVTRFSSSIRNGYTLHKKLTSMDNDTNLRLFSIPPSLRDSHEQMEMTLYTLDEKISATIEEFINTLGCIEHIDLINLYNNFCSYKIKIDNQASTRFDYNMIDMSIEVSAENVREMLIMALFYLASSDKFYSTHATGFIRKTGEYKLGSGLTRGYTEILACRYFGIDFDTMRYDMIDDLTGCIEVIVGQEKMEGAFFRGALDELIDELSLYSSREEAIRTIREIDHMETALKSGYLLTSMLSSKTYRNLYIRIANMLRKKLSTLDKSQIPELEYTFETLCDFLNSLYINGPTIFRIPKKEKYKTIALARQELENRGMSVKID